jgi:hypothetical protein
MSYKKDRDSRHSTLDIAPEEHLVEMSIPNGRQEV